MRAAIEWVQDRIAWAWEYLLDRLDERSSWAAIAVGLSLAGTVPFPWNLLILIVTAVQVLLPDGPVKSIIKTKTKDTVK